MGEWREMTLSQLGRIVTGKTPASGVPEYFGGDIPFVTPSDFDGRRIIASTDRYLTEDGADAAGRTRIPAGAVMVSCIGSDMGKTAIAGQECVTNQQINSIVVGEEHDSLFVYYDLSVRKAEIKACAGGSAQPILNKSAFGQLGIRLPRQTEQRAMAGLLGALDDKIEQNRRTAQALERLARAIFRAWFVDFQPVKAKAAGATAFPSMPQPVFDALPTRLVDSAIGPAPEGWEVGKLGDHCRINQRSVRAGEMSGAVEYVDISSVTVGRLTGLQRVPFSEAPSRARRRISHGDTIWSCVRPNQRSHLFIHSPPEKRIVSTGFAVLSPSSFGPSFLYEITTQPEFVDYLASNADGSAYPAVRSDHFASAEIVVPSELLLDAFEEATMPLRDSLAAGEQESVSLAAMRDYLLPKLLSGDVQARSIRTEKGLSSD